MVKAKNRGVVIQAKRNQTVPYRVYGDSEIDAFVKENKLPKSLAKKVKRHLTSVSP